ncbi:MAG: hypothetical protein JW940_20070, partial [Polyangiaceae bacterium]|nr:hypothetical protein [Polyangiaceae bacterium]
MGRLSLSSRGASVHGGVPRSRSVSMTFPPLARYSASAGRACLQVRPAHVRDRSGPPLHGGGSAGHKIA